MNEKLLIQKNEENIICYSLKNCIFAPKQFQGF